MKSVENPAEKELSWWNIKQNNNERQKEIAKVVDKRFIIRQHIIDLKQEGDKASGKETLFQGPILIRGGSVINRGYPVKILSLGRVGVTITSFFSLHVLITGLGMLKKTPP